MLPKSLCLALLLSAVPSFGKPPKLTLVITIDAMGTDVLMRMRPRLKGGLGKLIDQGAFFPTVQFEYAETVTTAGHATLATGANPWRHGLVSNKIVNRATGKEEPTLADANHPVLEAPLAVEDASPENLLAETVADRLRLFTQGRGKALSVSRKARAAIATAGRLGTAYWFNDAVGKFVTGTYYTKELPAWVKTLNEKRPAEKYFDQQWNLLAPLKDYWGEDDRSFESSVYALGRTFPHPMTGGLTKPGYESNQAFESTPFSNDLLVEFARAAIDGEQLGKDDQPDLLWISLSATDRVFHLFGPYSWEMQDAMLRVDKNVGDLVAAAEKAAGGRANLLIAVTADHGGAAIPEEWKAAGMPAARIDANALMLGLGKELKARFNTEDLISGLENVDLYLNPKTISDRKLDGAAVRRATAQWLSKQPGVAFALARDDLNGADDQTGYVRALKLGYYPGRSGDVLLVSKPFHLITDEATGTHHGSPYAYDKQVPFILAGKGVKSGYFREAVSATDIAPSLASLLEIGLPASAEGSPRAEAMSGAK